MAHDPVELLQRLIRFDTTNPPGNERECVVWAKALCDGVGLDTRIVAKDEARPNLLARLPGRGAAPPLLLQGHVDVVTTAGQSWKFEPFSGELVNGEVWGRGALDMKGGVAMMLGATLRRAESGEPPPGDVLLCLLADEENLGVFGARFWSRNTRSSSPGSGTPSASSAPSAARSLGWRPIRFRSRRSSFARRG